MSGFVALVQLDGAPVDGRILQDLTDALRFRGPDAEQVWMAGNAGLGHTMFRTTFEAEREVQPCSLDGSAWITGDIRIDGRKDLKRKLEHQGRSGVIEATDPELILHAYACWGDGCMDHLLGDFSFAIWDQSRQRLFCARDHFGRRGFYYSQIGSFLVVSNSLRGVRAHPRVSRRFQDLAICDVLMFGYNQDNATTCFADVQRLSPAHTLTWSRSENQGDIRIRRYWQLPIDEPLFYRRPSDYVEHFRELLDQAVEDRLRTDRVGIYLSGGLDSSLLAATTQKLASQSDPCKLQAYTCVFDRLFPDEERHYAGMVARHLGIPVHFLPADDYRPYQQREGKEQWRPPEPVHDPFRLRQEDTFIEAAKHSRVTLYGEGPDNLLMADGRRYLSYLWKRKKVGRLLTDVLHSFWVRPRIPMSVFRKTQPRKDALEFPSWIQPEMVSRYDLKTRWHQLWKDLETGPVHPARQRSYVSMQQTTWLQHFEGLDSDSAGIPVDVREPFLDIRVARFLLSVPAVPWCQEKHLMRASLKGLVPEPIRKRPKTPIRHNVLVATIRDGWPTGQKRAPPVPPELQRFVTEIPDFASYRDYSIWLHSGPWSLSLWISAEDEFILDHNGMAD